MIFRLKILPVKQKQGTSRFILKFGLMSRIFLLSLLVSQLLFSANISGKWRIDRIPGLKDDTEFLLYPTEIGARYSNIINFSENKFTVEYYAECGNDCFPYASGRYEMTDGNHVRLFFEKVSFSGMCSGRKKDYDPKDLGLFYISVEGENIRLIKSDGNIMQDLEHAKYSRLIDTEYMNQRNGPNSFTVQTKNGYSLQESIDARLAENGIFGKNELLFCKKYKFSAVDIALVRNGDRMLYLRIEK